MAVETECQTPGAFFDTKISSDGVISVTVRNTPFSGLTESEAQQLEGNIHNALELALAALWERKKKEERQCQT